MRIMKKNFRYFKAFLMPSTPDPGESRNDSNTPLPERLTLRQTP
jgi:hypothetical protein